MCLYWYEVFLILVYLCPDRWRHYQINSYACVAYLSSYLRVYNLWWRDTNVRKNHLQLCKEPHLLNCKTWSNETSAMYSNAV